MRASVGDVIIIASSVVGGHVRDGQVVALRHADGTPPYLVRWSDTGQEGLVYPGPDALIHSVRGARTASR